MASTPVKTSQVDRLGLGFTGASVNADATKLKGRASPESVRHFESLLDATNRAAPAEKPAVKPAARPESRADAPPKAPAKSEASVASVNRPAQPVADRQANASDNTDTAQAAIIAETAPEDAPALEAAAAEVIADAPAETPEDTNEAPVEAETGTDAVAIATPLPTLPVIVEPLPVQAASLPQAGDTQAVPTEVDLSQQEPLTLPQAILDDALAAAASAPQGATAVAPITDASPDLAPAQPASTPISGAPATPALAVPVNPAPVASTQQSSTPPAPAQSSSDDAIIEALTVIAPEAAAQTDASDVKSENVPAQQASDASTEAQSPPTAAQTTVVAPVIAETQPKAKPPAAKPQAEAVAQQDADTLAGLPKPEAAPATETTQDQNRQDQSPAERGRERAQERAQAGERLAARFADSQVSLIRDEASLSGPIQAFKAELKVAAAEANLAAATTVPQSDAAKAPTSATAAVVNNAATTGNAATAAKTAARPNSPVFQTPVVQQVGTRLVETAANGGGRVIMDLRPEHLGRVTIDVDVREDGRLTANVLVDNPAALEQLRRDAGQLEQALRDAGLNPEQNSLNFALREQAQENGGFGREGRRGRDANGDLLADAEIEPDVTAPTKQSVVPGLGVIDIRI